MWSRYRITLFDVIEEKIDPDVDFRVFQMAFTERSRQTINPEVPHVNHKCSVFFRDCYEDIGVVNKLLRVFDVILKGRPNIIVATGYSSVESWFVWFLKGIFGFKFLVTVDSGLNRTNNFFFKSLLKKLFLSRANVILAYGDSTVANLLSLNVSSKKIIWPFHCVDKQFYLKKDFLLSQRRAKFDGKIRFLFVGRLSSEKNIDFMLRNFTYAFSNSCLVSLCVVGDGPLRDEVQHFADSNTNIFYDGPKSGSQLVEYYLNSTALILPSTYEPWGLVANEALCLGASLVVSERCGCVPSFAEKDAGVYVFDPLSKTSFLESLNNVIVDSKYFNGDLIERNRTLGNKFSPELCAELFCTSIYSLLK